MPDPVASLSKEEREILDEVIRLLLARAVNREARLLFVLDMLKRMDPHQSWVWAGMGTQGRQQLVANIANGRVSSIELTFKV